MIIDVWLKIKNRGNLHLVLRHLNFWLGIFSDKSKYNITIYNENINLPNYYNPAYNIVNRHLVFKENKHCTNLNHLVNNSCITDNWKPAATALSAPYFYLFEKPGAQYVWNIDADDIMLYGPAKRYIEHVENKLMEYNLPTLSYDMHFSKHLNGNGDFRKHHWSFGVNFSKIGPMKEIIEKSLLETLPRAPWGINIDYIVDVYLEKQPYQYLCFATPYELVHTFGKNEECIFYSKYLHGVMETSFNFNGTLTPKHDRTLLIT